MTKQDKVKYRIKKPDGTFLNAGKGKDSWFNLDEARKNCNYDEGQIIVESDGINILWEVL